MTQKVALHLRCQDSLSEILDFQACRYEFAKELIVRFYLFVWSFHKDFTMFVPEAHQGLGPSGYLGYGQSAVIQRPAYFQEDYGVDYVTEYLSSHRIGAPFGQGQKAEILLACLDDTLNVSASEVLGEQLRRGELPVGKQHEVTEPDGQPILFLVLHRAVFVRVIQHVVPLPQEGVVLVYVHVGKDLLAEEVDLLPLAEVHVPAADEAVLSLVKAGAELVVEGLEREAPAGGHPSDEGFLRAVVKGTHYLLGDIACVEYEGVDGDVQADGHVVDHGHDSADVEYVAGDDVIPYGKPRTLVQHQHEAGLYGCGLDPVAAKGVERVVVDVVGKRRGVDVAAAAEVGMFLPHPLHERLEEGHAHTVPSHHQEVAGVAAQRRGRNVAEDVRCDGLLHEAVAGYVAPVPEDAVKDVAEYPLTLNFIGERNLQDVRHSVPHKKAQEQVCVAEHGVYLGLRKHCHVSGETNVIAAHLVEGVGGGVVGDQPPPRGKEYAGPAVGAEPHDFAEPLPNNLLRVVLSSVLHVDGFLDGGTAAYDISVAVPDQLLNPYECHVKKLRLIVLDSTTKLGIIFDTAKCFDNIFTKNQQISREVLSV